MTASPPIGVTAGKACADNNMHCLVCKQLQHMHSQQGPFWNLSGIAAQTRPDIMDR